MLQLNSLDIRLYWFADKLFDARVAALQGSALAPAEAPTVRQRL